MKLKKHLSFTSLRKSLSACFNKIPEYRQASKVDYSIHDALMSGFACMHFQDPSLLQFQKRLEKKWHKSNLHTLFDMRSIPESTQLRDIIDGIDGRKHFNYFFEAYFHKLQRGKHLEQFQLLPGLYYIPMDGTEYFSSGSVSCKQCLRTKPLKTKKGNKNEEIEEEMYHDEEDEKGIRYSHKAVQIAIVHPDMRQVIPLMPEEVYNTDGSTKQDCGTPRGVYQLGVKVPARKQYLLRLVSSFELMEVTT
jgi:hypothetical protein